MSAPSEPMPDVSVVIPCYHDHARVARHLPRLLSFLKDQGWSHEVIVVDDGSHDGTEQLAEEFAVTCLRLPSNRGKGAATRHGMLHARGRFRVFTDADIPYRLNDLAVMVNYLDAKEFHVVVGDRTLEGSDYRLEVAPGRRLASFLASNLMGRFVVGGFYDTQCGLKGFRAEVIEPLFAAGRIDRFAFDVELIYLALKHNYDIKRIAVHLECNEGSSVRLLRDSLRTLVDLARIKWYQLTGGYRF